MNCSNNPLTLGLESELPLFDQIRPENVLPALNSCLDDNHHEIERLTSIKNPDWESLMTPLDMLDERLQRCWSPVTHINAVMNSKELRPIYQQGVQKVAAYQTEVAQNEALYSAIKSVGRSADFDTYSDEQKQMLEHTLRDFRLAGAELKGDARARYKEIQMRLSELTTTFEQHVLDATRGFELLIIDEADLAGLPESVCEAANQRATEAGKSGWLFTLDIPSYLPFMQYAENRELRQQIYTAYVTRATGGELDNATVIDEILQLRKEAASLLGFDDYASYSLATKMAETTAEVTQFLRELAAKSRKMAEAEVKELTTFAIKELGLDMLTTIYKFSWWDPRVAVGICKCHSTQDTKLHRYPKFQVNRPSQSRDMKKASDLLTGWVP